MSLCSSVFIPFLWYACSLKFGYIVLRKLTVLPLRKYTYYCQFGIYQKLNGGNTYIHTYIYIYIYMYMYIYTEEKILALFSGWRWPASIVWPFALKLYSLNSTFFQSPLSYTKHHKKMPPRLQCIQKQNTNNCLSKIEPRCKHFKLDEWHHTAGFHSVVWSSLAQTTQ